MDFDQERTTKLYQELAEAREKIASLTAYAEELHDAALLLVGVLTHPNADHTEYTDEVALMQRALAKNPRPAGRPLTNAAHTAPGLPASSTQEARPEAGAGRAGTPLDEALRAFFDGPYSLIVGMAGIPNGVVERVPMIAQESFLAGRRSAGVDDLTPEGGL